MSSTACRLFGSDMATVRVSFSNDSGTILYSSAMFCGTILMASALGFTSSSVLTRMPCTSAVACKSWSSLSSPRWMAMSPTFSSLVRISS